MESRLSRLFDNPGTLLAILVAVLISLGSVMVYSASGARAGLENIRVQAQRDSRPEEEYRFHHGTDYFVKQLSWVAVGLLIGGVLLKVPVELYEKYAPAILIASFVILILVLTPLGVESKGAKRWMRLGPLTIQPSEFAKICLVIFMARLMADKREKMRVFRDGLLPTLGVLGCFTVLIILEKDLGTVMLMGAVVGGMWILARVQLKHLAILGIAALPLLGAFILKESYRQNRILAFLNPEKYAATYGYQLHQSLIAVGSGGVVGSGLGLGMQKYHFLSESHTDFIFAIVCEELGLIGALSILMLFLAYIMIGFMISFKSPDYFSGLLAAGLTMIVGFGAFINFFVVLGLAPTKGLALPFFSYGGSSMIANIMTAAILINIANSSLGAQVEEEL